MKIKKTAEHASAAVIASVMAFAASLFGPVANTVCVYQNLKSTKKNFGSVSSSHLKSAILSYVTQIPVYNKAISDIYKEVMKNIFYEYGNTSRHCISRIEKNNQK